MSTKRKIKLALDLDNTLMNSSEYIYSKAKKEMIPEIQAMTFDKFIEHYGCETNYNVSEDTTKWLGINWSTVHREDYFNEVNKFVENFVIKFKEYIDKSGFELVIDIVTARPTEYKEIFDRSHIGKLGEIIDKVVCNKIKYNQADEYDIFLDDDNKVLHGVFNKTLSIPLKCSKPYNEHLKNVFGTIPSDRHMKITEFEELCDGIIERLKEERE